MYFMDPVTIASATSRIVMDPITITPMPATATVLMVLLAFGAVLCAAAVAGLLADTFRIAERERTDALVKYENRMLRAEARRTEEFENAVSVPCVFGKVGDKCISR
jgi:hypothetical protein